MKIENFDIARRVRQLRLRVKISQEEFAEYAEMNYKFYQQIESGRRSHLRVETVERICAAYHKAERQQITTSQFLLKRNIHSTPATICSERNTRSCHGTDYNSGGLNENPLDRITERMHKYSNR